MLAYCTWYFADDEPGLASFAGNFVAFAGAMLGLVLADDLLLLYVFWELTTVFSYLLIGHDPTKRAEPAGGHAGPDRDHPRRPGHAGRHPGRRGRRRARSGSASCSPTRRPGPPSRVAVALLLVGAVSKSALFPFHFWLPGRDGGTDPGQRLPARRGDGQGRRLPRRAARPGVRRSAGVARACC